MFRSFSQSLATRLGLVLVLVETLVMSTLGVVYYNNFASQVDTRQEDKLRGAVQVIAEGGLNLKTLVDKEKMSLIVGDQIEDAMLIDKDTGDILFSLNPDYRRVAPADVPFLDPQITTFDSSTIQFNRLEWDHLPYLTSTFAFNPVRNRNYILYLRIGVSESEQEKRSITLLLVVGFLATIVATSLVIFFFFSQSILVRIQHLVQVMSKVEKGNLSVRAGKHTWLGSGKDELGILQRGTNAMIEQLQELLQTLEQRVADRTRDLTISAEVSRQVATALDRDTVLKQLVELTAQAFGLYQVSIFLLDGSKQNLTLVAASGHAGAQMLAEEKQFSINEPIGIVPLVARTHTFAGSNDVSTYPEHKPNPLLPNTRSEVALPLIFGGELLGVLDLQSDQKDRFSDSYRGVFTSLVNQFSVAIRNAGLFEEVQNARVQAEQADIAKSAFLASTSHELRTPLNAIINLSSFVRRGTMGPITPRQDEILGLVMQSGQNLLSLINDVLDMSKIESGSLRLYVERDVDLKPIIYEACATAQSLITTKPVKLTMDIADDLPLLEVDKHRVRQILLNLLSNACKFTEEGEIRVETLYLNHEVQISISDTGSGIAPEDHDKVFEKFKQTESGLRQGGGTGLGMPITKSLVEAHQGRIWLESAPGVGSTFYIALPLVQTHVETRSQEGDERL
jgi:signal transduction histidine kinase